jgi:hypothetical protein
MWGVSADVPTIENALISCAISPAPRRWRSASLRRGASGLIHSGDSDPSLIRELPSAVFVARTNADPRSFIWTANPKKK